MVWTIHPPLELSEHRDPPPAAADAFLHVHLWLSGVVERWRCNVAGHMHLVTGIDAGGRAGASWEILELARNPLAVSTRPRATLGSNADEALDELLRRAQIPLFRVPTLGMISEPGESLESFRRRIAGMMRLDAGKAPGDVRLIATGLRDAQREIEETALRPLEAFVGRREAGLLYISESAWEALDRRPLPMGSGR